MRATPLTASFRSGEDLETALSDLRRLGAVRCAGSLVRPGESAAPTLRITVRRDDASMARAVLRRAGGVIL